VAVRLVEVRVTLVAVLVVIVWVVDVVVAVVDVLDVTVNVLVVVMIASFVQASFVEFPTLSKAEMFASLQYFHVAPSAQRGDTRTEQFGCSSHRWPAQDNSPCSALHKAGASLST